VRFNTALLLGSTTAVAILGCGASTTVVNEPKQPEPATTVTAPPPGGETKTKVETPDGKETEIKVETEKD